MDPKKLKQVNEFLRLLLSKKLSFIILRGFDFLQDPENNDTSEIDILINKPQEQLLLDILIKHRFYFLKTFNHIGVYLSMEDIRLSVDFQVEYIRELNIECFSFATLNKYKENIKGFPCLSGAALSAHLLMHAVLAKNYFKTEYSQAIADYFKINCDYEDFKILLSDLLSEKDIHALTDHLKHGQFNNLERSRRKYIIKVLLKKPIQLINLLFYSFKKIRNKADNIGFKPVVALIGLDGTGKTTIAKNLSIKLNSMGIKNHYVYMGRVRSHVLPMDIAAKKIGVSRGKRDKKLSLHYKMLREVVYLLDMFLRYFVFIFPWRLRNHFVICDRYAYDLYLDANRTNLSRIILKYLYPKAEPLVFLDLEEKEIIRRKDEYGPEKRRFLKSCWNKVRDDYKHVMIISDNLEKNIHEIFIALFNK
ncbi:MAG: hypothetical protein ABIA04_03235 [Pseudomonadota bacterium]